MNEINSQTCSRKQAYDAGYDDAWHFDNPKGAELFPDDVVCQESYQNGWDQGQVDLLYQEMFRREEEDEEKKEFTNA